MYATNYIFFFLSLTFPLPPKLSKMLKTVNISIYEKEIMIIKKPEYTESDKAAIILYYIKRERLKER